MAARVLAAAGCRSVLAAGKAGELAAIARECRATGAEVLEVNARSDSEAACAGMVAQAVAAFGALGIFVVASGMHKLANIDCLALADFTAVIEVNVTQSWLLARAQTLKMQAQGSGKIVMVSSARGLLGHPGGLYRLLRQQCGGRWHDQGAGM